MILTNSIHIHSSIFYLFLSLDSPNLHTVHMKTTTLVNMAKKKIKSGSSAFAKLRGISAIDRTFPREILMPGRQSSSGVGSDPLVNPSVSGGVAIRLNRLVIPSLTRW